MKNTLIKLFLIIFVPLLITFLFFEIQTFLITQNLKKYWAQDEIKVTNQLDVFRCNFPPFSPKFVFVSDHLLLGEIPEVKIYFYKLVDFFGKNVDEAYEGTTSISGFDFSSILEMLRHDCTQFQNDYGKYRDDQSWTYSNSKGQSEIDLNKVKMVKIWYQGYSETIKILFINEYGEIDKMNNIELIQVYDSIVNEGLDVKILDQIKYEELDYQKRLKSGEVKNKTHEDVLRAAGLDEAGIKKILEENNIDYKGF